MPAKKSAKPLKTARKQPVAKARTVAKKAVARGKSAVRSATAKTSRRRPARRAVEVKDRSLVDRLPSRRQIKRGATHLVEQMKEGVQSGIEAVTRIVKKVTPGSLRS